MPDKNELSGLKLSEFSICFEDLGGAANEDCTIEFVKSQSGLAPTLKETDMSDDNIQKNDGEGDAEFNEFANEVLDEFEACESDEDRADFIVGLAAHGAEHEAAVADAAEVIKSLTKNTVPKEKHEAVLKTLQQAGSVIEKMKAGGKVSEDDDTLSRITKSLAEQMGGEGNIPDDVRATLSDLVKSRDASELKESIEKAKKYGFGKAEDVAGLETRIRKALGDKDADLYAAQIKQAGAIVKASKLTVPLGEDAGNVDATSPIAKAKSGAAEIKKANPNLSDAQAMTQYWREHPDEYAAMRQGQAA